MKIKGLFFNEDGAGGGDVNADSNVSVEGTISNIHPAPIEPEVGGDFLSTVPEAFRDRDWLKPIKSQEDLYTQVDNLQKKLGERVPVIPGAEASQEEWDTFKASCRPKNAADYEIPVPEGQERNEAVEGKVKELFHSAGLTPKQAQEISQGFDSLVEEIKGESAQQDVDFDKLATETFGERTDKVLANAKEMLRANVPENFKELVEGLPNEQLIIMSSVLDSVHQKYIKEDRIGSDSGVSKTTSIDDLKAEGRTKMASDAYQNGFHPNHEKVKAEVNDIYVQIGKLQNS